MNAPIIIIGAARSGTKFLRDTLAAGPGTACVPYDVNYVWRYQAEHCPHDQLSADDLTAKQAQFIRKTLPRLARLHAGDLLIEKTVSNTLRVPYVAKVLPEARFVHLIRNGCNVTESAMRQWQSPPDWKALFTKLRSMPLNNAGYAAWFAKNMISGLGTGRQGGKVWGPRYPGIDEHARTKPLHEVCALQWQYSVDQARRDLATLPDRQVFEIRYEDLVSSTDVLVELIQALGLPGEQRITDAYNKNVKKDTASGWGRLSEAQQHTIRQTLAPTLTDLGYRT